MKKMKSWLMLLAIACTSISLVSCDDDPWDGPDNWRDPYGWYDDYDGWGWNDNDWNHGSGGSQSDKLIKEAQTLVGEWMGTVKYSYINDDGQSRGVDEYYADMIFYQSNNQSSFEGGQNTSLSGSGIEKDWITDKDGNVEDEKDLRFSWYIDNNGDIYIKYNTADAYTFVLDFNAKEHGFRLGKYDDYENEVFYGWMIGVGKAEGNLINFNFERVVSDNNNNAKSFSRSASSGTASSFGNGATLSIQEAGAKKLNNRK